MRKTPILKQETQRVVLRHGTRAVLVLECELPLGDAVVTHHAKEVADALFAHAEREYLPVAASELEMLVSEGRGYAFTPHRLQFTARITRAGAGLCMKFSLCYTVGGEVRLAQSAQSYWTADGAYRCRRMLRAKKAKRRRKENIA